MNTNDRRIRKTKKALREALAKLLAEKELHEITVQELADTADIHRGTFYAHYQDVYDLYAQLEESVINELNAVMESDKEYTYAGLYTSLIDYIYKNAEICKMLFKPTGSHNFQNRICAWLEEVYLNGWKQEEKDLQINERLHFLATYHIRGCITIIDRWVKNDFNCPKHDVIKLLHDVDYNIDRIIS